MSLSRQRKGVEALHRMLAEHGKALTPCPVCPTCGQQVEPKQWATHERAHNEAHRIAMYGKTK